MTAGAGIVGVSLSLCPRGWPCYHGPSMNSAIVVVLLGVLTAVSWGVSDFLCAKSAKAAGPVTAAVVVNTLSLAAFAVLYMVLFRGEGKVSGAGIGLAVASGVVIAAGTALFFVALAAGPVSIVSPLTSVYPFVTTVVALMIFRAHLSGRELVGVILVLAGVMAASGLLTTGRPAQKVTKGPALALLTAVLWGIGYALLAQAMKQLGWQTATLVELACIAGVLLVALPFVRGKEVLAFRVVAHVAGSKTVLSAAAIQLLGVLAFNAGLARSGASGGAVVTAVSACYPILTIILSLKHFQEEIRLVALAGACAGIVGVVVLSLG